MEFGVILTSDLFDTLVLAAGIERFRLVADFFSAAEGFSLTGLLLFVLVALFFSTCSAVG